MEYGLTQTGFFAKDVQTIYNEIFDEIENRTGVKVNRNYDSIIGSLVQVIASREAQTWQILQDIYYQSFPISASGDSLSKAVSLVGLKPFGAVASRVYCKCGATGEVKVPKETQAINPKDSEDVWETVEDQYITTQKAIEVDFNITYAPYAEYFLNINGDGYSFITNNEPMTANTIFNTFATHFSYNKNVKFEFSDNLMKIKAINEEVPFSVSSNINTSTGNAPNPNMVMTALYSLLRFDRVDITDNTFIEPKTITEVITEKTKITSIINNLPMLEGIVTETDANLRARFLAFRCSPRASAMKEAIKNNILNYVDLVKYCEVYENRKDTTNEVGMLPHSVMVVVEGGDNQQIAQMIYKNACAGIDFNGNITEMVNGNEIKFMRPHNERVYVNITVIRDNMYDNNITNQTIKSIKLDIEYFFEKIGCAQTVSAKKIEQVVLKNTGNYADDINIELSTVSLDDAIDSNRKILSGKIDTHYYFDNSDNLGVRIYVVDARNTTKYVVQ